MYKDRLYQSHQNTVVWVSFFICSSLTIQKLSEKERHYMTGLISKPLSQNFSVSVTVTRTESVIVKASKCFGYKIHNKSLIFKDLTVFLRQKCSLWGSVEAPLLFLAQKADSFWEAGKTNKQRRRPSFRNCSVLLDQLRWTVLPRDGSLFVLN